MGNYCIFSLTAGKATPSWFDALVDVSDASGLFGRCDTSIRAFVIVQGRDFKCFSLRLFISILGPKQKSNF